MRRLISAGTLTALLLTSGCAPRAAYVAPIGAFATQADKLGSSVTAELEHFETDRRAQYLRQDLFQAVRNQLTSSSRNSTLRTAQIYLCKPRVLAGGYANNSNYLSAVSASLKNVSGEPSKTTGDLVKALFDSYDIKVPPAPAAGEDKQCTGDFTNYVTIAYPSTQTEFLGAAEGAQALWKVFDTLANAVLQDVDDARRAAALHDYFANKGNGTDKSNVEVLKATIAANGKFLSAAAESRRFLDIRNMLRAYGALKKTMDGTDISKTASCAAAKAVPPQGDLGSDPGFKTCFDDVWDSLQDPMQKFLTAAAAYDKDAAEAPGAAADELNKTLDKLTDIATNKNVSKDTVAAMITSLVNAAADLSTLVDKASSDDTKTAVDNALAKF